MELEDVLVHLETGLPDEAVQRILDSEQEELVNRYGSLTTHEVTVHGGWPEIILYRPAASITTVTEYGYQTGVVVPPTDFMLLPGGHRLVRVDSGVNYYVPIWATRVKVEYVPLDQTRLRERILVDLVKLAINYNGLSEEWFGDYKAKHPNYNREREKLLKQAAPNRGLLIV